MKSLDWGGSCPVCGGRNDFLDRNGERWFFCETHRVCWSAGAIPVEAALQAVPDATWSRSRFESFLVVDGWSHPRKPPKLPDSVTRALELVLDYLWADEARNYDASPPDCPSSHVFPALCRLRWWATGLVTDEALSPEELG